MAKEYGAEAAGVDFKVFHWHEFATQLMRAEGRANELTNDYNKRQSKAKK